MHLQHIILLTNPTEKALVFLRKTKGPLLNSVIINHFFKNSKGSFDKI